MSVETTLQACGNDHGFIFKRGRAAAAAVKAIGRVQAAAVPASEAAKSPGKRPATPTMQGPRLDFPERKRRPGPAPGPAPVLQELHVPVAASRPAQPTPLIARTRTRAAKSPGARRRATASAQRRASRKSAAAARRRSTFSMRGKRASSIGGGFAALPHDSVDAADFYRHVSPELPEPVRLRQLLAWCARRAFGAPAWPAALPEHVQALLGDALREAVDDIHSAFERGDIATSWYHRPVAADDAGAAELRPHPENAANADARERLHARIACLQAENDAWVRELKRASAEHARALDRLPRSLQADAEPEPLARAPASVDWAAAADGGTAAAQYLAAADAGAISSELGSADELIARATRDIEVRLDAFHLDMHRASDAHARARAQCARRHAHLGFVFAQRRERAQAVAAAPAARDDDDPAQASAPDSTRDLLRTLAATLAAP
ncbi:hypothetical protein H4S01_003124 [Coemansia sp. RSA 2610]|nr:hypothetical protein H4S01_003124 [Coemansia sp. RSA 2610]